MRQFLTKPARPSRNVQCIAFMASAALVGAMMAQGIRVRLNILDRWHYVAPLEDIGKDRLWELLQHDQFKYIAVVTFLVSPTGSNQTFTIPGNWNSSQVGPVGYANKVETIAGGGSGGGAFATAGFISADASGGGGGAYSAITNLVFVPGTTVTYQIGAGGSAIAQSTVNAATNGNPGGATWFNGTSLGASSVGAVGGAGGTGDIGGGAISGGSGGAAASGVGSTRNSGGNGGSCGATGGGGIVSSGGGGAAGPNGNGTSGGSATNGGTSNGGNADNNTVSGGAGGNPNGSTGGAGTEFDPSHGCGGGGGGGINASGSSTAGSGGNYGGGGGGAASDTPGPTATSGSGAQGLGVVTNIPATRAIWAGIIG